MRRHSQRSYCEAIYVRKVTSSTMKETLRIREENRFSSVCAPKSAATKLPLFGMFSTVKEKASRKGRPTARVVAAEEFDKRSGPARLPIGKSASTAPEGRRGAPEAGPRDSGWRRPQTGSRNIPRAWEVCRASDEPENGLSVTESPPLPRKLRVFKPANDKERGENAQVLLHSRDFRGID